MNSIYLLSYKVLYTNYINSLNYKAVVVRQLWERHKCKYMCIFSCTINIMCVQ